MRLALGAPGTERAIVIWTEQQKDVSGPLLKSLDVGCLLLLTTAGGSDGGLLPWGGPSRSFPQDGKHYILNGQKMWITTAAGGRLFTVFAISWGRKVHRFGWCRAQLPCVSRAVEEHKIASPAVLLAACISIMFHRCQVFSKTWWGGIGGGASGTHRIPSS